MKVPTLKQMCQFVKAQHNIVQPTPMFRARLQKRFGGYGQLNDEEFAELSFLYWKAVGTFDHETQPWLEDYNPWEDEDPPP